MTPGWKKAALAAAFAASLIALALALLLRPYPAAALAPATAALTVTDRHGELLRVVPGTGIARARWVPLTEVAPLAVVATLAGEDRRFFQHPGVDARALLRAAFQWVTRGRIVSGGSTLTMQLARTLAPRPRTLLGKLGEVRAALRLERTLDKRAVLEQYLNRVGYGAGALGIESAAQRFFGRPAAALGDGEATLLAVLPRAPRAYDLRRDAGRAAALARRAQVLLAMERGGFITAEAHARIAAEPLRWAAAPGATPPRPPDQAAHFVDWVLAQNQGGAGPALRTTLDLPLQRRLERLVRAQMNGRAAGVVVLEPATGAVRAMVVASAPDAPAAVNITTTPRHPGSACKPFLYALALERGAHPATVAHDTRAALPSLRVSPRTREHGDARLRDALAGSYNLAALGLLAEVGVAPLLERLRAAGLGPLAGGVDDYGLALALGAGKVRLVDLAAAYGAFVNGGRVVRAAGVAAPAPRDDSRALFSPEVSWLVLDMLADAGARRRVFGAELPVDLPFPVAVKTGTSAGFADTVAVAVTREAVVAAWSGALDGSGTRGTLAMWSAAPLVRAALLAIADENGKPLSLPPPPPTLLTRDVCALSGHLPGAACPTKREHFAPGHTPGVRCPGHALAGGQ